VSSGRRRGAFAALAALLTLTAPGPAAQAARHEDGVAELDRRLSGRHDAAAERDVLRWAAGASLDDLVYLLRRPSRELDALKAPLAEAALARTADTRPTLKRQLTARLALADPKHARKIVGTLDAGALRALRPDASPFRVAVLLPDSGDYRGYARAVRAGANAAFEAAAPTSGRRVQAMARSSGADDPARTALALATALDSADAVIGDLLSVPTLALATAARVDGFVLVSPTATDESIGSVALSAFAVGPPGRMRGAALARAVIQPSQHPRLAIATGAVVAGNAFVRGFVETATKLGASIVWREPMDSGASLESLSERLAAKKPDVLFWEGETRDAEALLRQLGTDHVALRICGGENLAPDRFHAENRQWLEGVRYVDEDWRLPPETLALLDRAAHRAGTEVSHGLETRGYLAARALLAAIEAGALAPNEIAAKLGQATLPEDAAGGRRFLDPSADDATLAVWTVVRGKPTLTGP